MSAIGGQLQIIVTDDRKGLVGLYPNPDDCPYEVHAADDFLLLVADSAPELIDRVIEHQFSYYLGAGKHFNLAPKLVSAGCPNFADCVRSRMQHIQLLPLHPSSVVKAP